MERQRAEADVEEQGSCLRRPDEMLVSRYLGSAVVSQPRRGPEASLVGRMCFQTDLPIQTYVIMIVFIDNALSFRHCAKQCAFLH